MPAPDALLEDGPVQVIKVAAAQAARVVPVEIPVLFVGARAPRFQLGGAAPYAPAPALHAANLEI